MKRQSNYRSCNIFLAYFCGALVLASVGLRASTSSSALETDAVPAVRVMLSNPDATGSLYEWNSNSPIKDLQKAFPLRKRSIWSCLFAGCRKGSKKSATVAPLSTLEIIYANSSEGGPSPRFKTVYKELGQIGTPMHVKLTHVSPSEILSFLKSFPHLNQLTLEGSGSFDCSTLFQHLHHTPQLRVIMLEGFSTINVGISHEMRTFHNGSLSPIRIFTGKKKYSFYWNGQEYEIP